MEETIMTLAYRTLKEMLIQLRDSAKSNKEKDKIIKEMVELITLMERMGKENTTQKEEEER